MLAVDPVFWANRRVFLTGHTGFKGAWLYFWLRRMGADVTGYALAPSTTPSLFALLDLPQGHVADVRDTERLAAAVAQSAPEIVFHLAAQALVLPSYQDPVGTIATNVTGTAALLDAVRHAPSVRAAIIVTSDKCYENREWLRGYNETDALGGHDPYSASKGAAEIVVAAMRRSFFLPEAPGGHPAGIASVRAGNVIGGGDWSPDRLMPDIVRACMGGDGAVVLRHPDAIRPWQHVLEPIAAYLGLAQRLHAGERLAEAFNFGPSSADERPVRDVAAAMIAALGRGRISVSSSVTAQPHEAHLLRLDCAKANTVLGWQPRWGFAKSIQATADWYAALARGEDAAVVTAAQIDAFQKTS